MTSIRLELSTPADDDRPVFVTGNFCQWYPDVDRFRMQPVGPGSYVAELPAGLSAHAPLEYKYTRGSWDSVELNRTGESVPNRLSRRQTGTRRDVVPHWRWYGQPFNPAFLPKVSIVSEAFAAPQLNATRRVRVLLPHNYETSNAHYPVLYLNDGQNLFGEGSSFGNWSVDQKLAILAHRHHHEVIIVAIDHGDRERVAEFLPYNTRLANGQGRAYLDFIVHTLKPHIDATYRTRPGRSHTGIGGSSMGGLISVYAGLIHPSAFGRLMVFSPSLWATPKVYSDALRYYHPELTKVYLYGGKQESAYMVPAMQRLQEVLVRQGHNQSMQLQLSVDPRGKHNESRWGREFPQAVEWLFF